MQKINLSYKGNEDLKAALAGKKPGDECSMTLTVKVEANDDAGFSAGIVGVEREDYSEGYAEEEAEMAEEVLDPEMEDASPILVVMRGPKSDD